MMRRLPSKELWREYESEYDVAFYQHILKILLFINKHIGTGEVHSPEVLSRILDELTAYYESLATWLAKRRSEIDTAKTEYDVQFATIYLGYKEKGKTDGTSKELAKIEMVEKKKEIDRLRKSWLLIEALRKSIGHYIDSVRSQLSYEKEQQKYVTGRQG